MSAPISGKGSDVATREQAVGASARRARQKVGRALIGSLDGVRQTAAREQRNDGLSTGEHTGQRARYKRHRVVSSSTAAT